MRDSKRETVRERQRQRDRHTQTHTHTLLLAANPFIRYPCVVRVRACRSKHSTKAVSDMSDILSSLVEAGIELDDQLLDILFAPLLPRHKVLLLLLLLLL